MLTRREPVPCDGTLISRPRRNSPAGADLSAADYVRLLHPSGSIGKVSFVMIRSRDEAITRTYSAETAPIIAESLLDESTYLTLNRFDLLPVESAFFSSVDFHPELTRESA